MFKLKKEVSDKSNYQKLYKAIKKYGVPQRIYIDYGDSLGVLKDNTIEFHPVNSRLKIILRALFAL